MRPILLLTINFALLGVAIPAAAQQSGDFAYSSDSTSITITRYLGNGGFVTIPGTIDGLPVTNIERSAFSGCTGLTGLTLGNSVATIGSAAFSDCTSLASVMIPKSVISISATAFPGCVSLVAIQVDLSNPVYSSSDGVLFNKDQTTLVAYPPGIEGHYTMPNTVTNVGFMAFYNCTRLTSVLMPDGLTTIDLYAFAGCSGLTNIVIPSDVNSIGNSAFERCTRLTEVVIPNRVASIEPVTFMECRGLTNVVIPDSVTSIHEFAFDNCKNLASMTIPNRVKEIGAFALMGCGLTNLMIGHSVKTIRESAFGSCTKLSTLTIPASVTFLEGEAFANCTDLTTVFFEGNAPSHYVSTFAGTDNATIYYLPGTLGWGPTYRSRPTAPWWLPTPTILTIPQNFGVQTNRFGFVISWATNASVVVEASESLADPAWSPVSTNELSEGWSQFIDPEQATYPARLYRLRSP